MGIEAPEATDVAETAGRVGLAARGVLYLVVALLAARIALAPAASGDEHADQQGALARLADQPLGTVLLVLLAVGFAGYAVWRAVRAVEGEERHKDPKPHKRLADAGRALLHLSLLASTIGVLRGDQGGDDRSRTWTVRLMELGWGRWVVGAVGLVLLGTAVWMVRRAFTEGFRKHLERHSDFVIRAGKIGYAGRGIAFGFIGAFLLRAAWRFDTDEPIGLDAALHDLASSGWGRAVVLAVAIGLGSFGLFSIAEARDRRVLE
jgi:hypothetical protein